jgi:hypothetical protein
VRSKSYGWWYGLSYEQIEPGGQTEQPSPSGVLRLRPRELAGFKFLTVSVAPHPVWPCPNPFQQAHISRLWRQKNMTVQFFCRMFWVQASQNTSVGKPADWAKVDINKRHCLAKFQCSTASTSDVLQADTISSNCGMSCMCYLLWNSMHHSCWYGFLAEKLQSVYGKPPPAASMAVGQFYNPQDGWVSLSLWSLVSTLYKKQVRSPYCSFSLFFL